jgi:hypothetical protein
MIPEVMNSIRDVLNADTTLQGYLGVDHVILGWPTERTVIPCVSIIENTEASRRRSCYTRHGHRDSFPVIQIDIWINREQEDFPNSGDDCGTIATRIDGLLFGVGIENTREWERVSESGPRPDGVLLHMTLRYSFRYSVSDSS